MGTDNKHELALQVLDRLCEAMDSHDWKYNVNRDALVIQTGAQGEDLPMDLIIRVDENRQLVMLLSKLPFTVKEDKRLDMAVAVSIVNNRLVDGCFDLDVKTGVLGFRMTSSYIESVLGKDLFAYMLFCSCGTIDDYNDKFMMLSTGMISLEQFMDAMNK